MIRRCKNGASGDYHGWLAVLITAAILFWPMAGGAITLTVNTLDDSTTVDGQLSLREAIEAANTDTSVDGSFAGSGADTIRFAPGISGGTITLSGTQLPIITESLTITALDVGGMTIDGDDQSRIFQIGGGIEVVVELKGLTLTNARNSNPFGPAWGGGAVQSFGTLIVSHCAVTNSITERGFGGGLSNEAGARMTIHNSTISGNSAGNGGGGIYANNNFQSRLTIVNSTITDNRADSNDDANGTDGGISAGTSVRVYLYNTIVAGNRTTLDAVNDLRSTAFPFNSIDEAHYTIIGDPVGAGGLIDGVNNTRVGVDPLLGPLQDNGGVSFTHEPTAPSPAIDAGRNAFALDGSGSPLTGNSLIYDQRGPGFGRYLGPGGIVDIGAAEYTGQLLTVTTIDDEDDGALGQGAGDSLREVINEANGAAGPNKIDFAAGLSGMTITLGGTQLPIITDHVVITGPGAGQLTLDGDSISRIFEIATDIRAEISDMTLTGGSATTGGGGGAIKNAGRLLVRDCVFDQNTSGNSGNGGALYNIGNARVESSTFSNNSGQQGGAIANFANSSFSMDVLNSTFFNNAAEFDGGGIFNNGNAVIRVRNSTITGNRADKSDRNVGDGGGGMHRGVDSFVTLYNTIIAGNFRGSGTTANDFFGQPVFNLSAYNIIGVDTGFGVLDANKGNQVGTAAVPIDPLLDVLADNGGNTPTMALLAGSRAIDRGNPGVAGNGGSTCEPSDQRRVLRIGFCDIGAFELPDVDGDLDGIADEVDNCPAAINTLQLDTDADDAGDVCDTCPDDATDTCSPDESAAAEITPETGGMLETGDGLTLDLDPGDVGETTTITIVRNDPGDPEIDLSVGGTPGSGEAIATYDFQPDGLVFEGPVLLTIVTDVSLLTQMQRDNLDLYRDDGLGDFVALGANCNVVENPSLVYFATCSVLITHFTLYALVAPLDTDTDGVPNNFNGVQDNCPLISNPGQEDVCNANNTFIDGFEDPPPLD